MKKKGVFTALAVLFLSVIFYCILSNIDLGMELQPLPRVGISLAIGILMTLVLTAAVNGAVKFFSTAQFSRVFIVICGINLACLFGGIIGIPLSTLPSPYDSVFSIIVMVLILMMNMVFVYNKLDQLIDLVDRVTDGKFKLSEAHEKDVTPVLLDTSVIIDSRISDIAHCGFIPGTLLVPVFVLKELQFIADSEDPQKRQRGRRGLDTLNAMQKDPLIKIKIIDLDVPTIKEVDAKLIHFAIELNCPILTNDYNLNKVAELQGIRILNVNDLTNAVKSILLPGERMHIQVIQEGKGVNQGVGYLEDGTMVVVEDGRSCVNQDVDVVVTKILQTAAGRMIFARQEKELGVRR